MLAYTLHVGSSLNCDGWMKHIFEVASGPLFVLVAIFIHHSSKCMIIRYLPGGCLDDKLGRENSRFHEAPLKGVGSYPMSETDSEDELMKCREGVVETRTLAETRPFSRQEVTCLNDNDRPSPVKLFPHTSFLTRTFFWSVFSIHLNHCKSHTVFRATSNHSLWVVLKTPALCLGELDH